MTETIFLLLWIIMTFLQSIVIANTALLLDNKQCVVDTMHICMLAVTTIEIMYL